jgi:hypothetical protein
LGAFKTCKVVHYFYWPKLEDDVFHYARQCELRQHSKLAQNVRMGLHTVTPTSCAMERVFAFMRPPVRTKRGNRAILVAMDSFSKFMAFFPYGA